MLTEDSNIQGDFISILVQIAQIFRTRVAHHCEEFSLSDSAALTLIVLGTPLSMQTICYILDADAPRATFIANDLQKRGFLERSVDPADKRSRLLTLTAKGNELRHRLLAPPQALVGSLSAQDLISLSSILGKATSA